MRNRCAPPRGFTIIELLVSVGIISVIMALLAPAVMSVRERARRINCQSNLRQIGLSLDMYVDNQGSFGIYPYAAVLPSVNIDNPSLVIVLDGDIGHNRPVYACPDDAQYYPTEGLSFEYSYVTLAGKTRAELTARRPANRVQVLFDYDPVHGTQFVPNSRNMLYLDGHVEPF